MQLALHQSLQPQGQLDEQKEAAALQQALALSLLEPSPWEAGELPGRAAGQAQLVVHVAFEQDLDELDRAVAAALECHLREETVGLRGHMLPAELLARLERRHSVSVALDSDCVVLRGFGAQPSRAARHLAALLAGPRDQSLAYVSEASNPTRESAAWDWGLGWASSRETVPQAWPRPFPPCVSGPWQRPKGPLGRLESLAESSREFQEVVQAFYDTLDTGHGRVRIVRVSPRSVLSISWLPGLMPPFSPCRACGLPSCMSGSAGQELPSTGQAGSSRLPAQFLPRVCSPSLGGTARRAQRFEVPGSGKPERRSCLCPLHQRV